MIAYQDAVEIVKRMGTLQSTKFTALTESVSLQKALGRVLAAPVVCQEMIPALDNSAMDGFAVCSSDLLSASLLTPVQLKVVGMLAAGDSVGYEKIKVLQESQKTGAGVALEIMTGAPVPKFGAAKEKDLFDAVIKIEDVKVQRNEAGQAIAILVSLPVSKGANIRLKGTDFSVGQRVLETGTFITPEHIMACASVGAKQLNVLKKARVAIISTGSELKDESENKKETLPGLTLHNSTGPYLEASLKNLGVEVLNYGVVPDNPNTFEKLVIQALEQGVDAIVSTGAVSMGQFDFVPAVLKKINAKVYFHKVAIRPGKPILFSEINRSSSTCVFFGIPGNPIASAVGLRFFVVPYLRSLMNLAEEKAISATLTEECYKPEGLRCFFKGYAALDSTDSSDSATLKVKALKGQASYMVSSLVEANCWVVLSEVNEKVETKTKVNVYALEGSLKPMKWNLG